MSASALRDFVRLIKAIRKHGVTTYEGPMFAVSDKDENPPLVKITLTKCQTCDTNELLANVESKLTSPNDDYMDALLHSTGVGVND